MHISEKVLRPLRSVNKVLAVVICFSSRRCSNTQISLSDPRARTAPRAPTRHVVASVLVIPSGASTTTKPTTAFWTWKTCPSCTRPKSSRMTCEAMQQVAAWALARCQASRSWALPCNMSKFMDMSCAGIMLIISGFIIPMPMLAPGDNRMLKVGSALQQSTDTARTCMHART